MRIMGASAEEMDGGDLSVPLQDYKEVTNLGLSKGKSKPFQRERNGALHGAHAFVLPKKS